MSFSTKFLKIKKILLYSITWSLTLNFHHLVKKLSFLQNFTSTPTRGIFTIHCFLDSNHHIKIPLPAKFPISLMGRYPRASHRCWDHGGTWINTWGEWGGGCKMLLKNICEGVHMLVKLPAISLQACKFTKNELLHTYFSRILARF